jgi:hypothetical protein
MKMSEDSEEDFSLGQVLVMLAPWLTTKKQGQQQFPAAKKHGCGTLFFRTCAMAACNFSLVCKNE